MTAADRNHRAWRIAQADPAGTFRAIATKRVVEALSGPDNRHGMNAVNAAERQAGQDGLLANDVRMMFFVGNTEVGAVVIDENGAVVVDENGAVVRLPDIPTDVRNLLLSSTDDRGNTLRVLDVLRRTAARDGLCLLTVAVEAAKLAENARTITRCNPGSLPRLHRANREETAMLRGFESLPPTTPAPDKQAMLPSFQPFTNGVPSWLLSMWDATLVSSSQRGRKGAPWIMRLWIYAAASVPVGDRCGFEMRLPLRLRDIERLIWPKGWDRSNRRKYYPDFRRALLNLGAVRPIIYGPDGLPYRLEVVRAPVVPEQWSADAACPIFVTIPPSAAAGARFNWDRLIVYGADSPGIFRAYLAVVAVLDYSARNGAGITRRIAAPLKTADGKTRRGKRGRILRDPDVKIDNPAALYVHRNLTDEDLRWMIGLPNHHREYRMRARRFMERLDEDGVIELFRNPDGTVRIFAPGSGKG